MTVFLFAQAKGGIMNRTSYIKEKEVARITGRALPTLRNDRHHRRGIPYCKIGRSVRYCIDDVIAYMEAHKIKTEGI